MESLIKKIIVFSILSLFTLNLALLDVEAVTLDPNSGEMNANGTSEITLRANPINGEVTVKVDLDFVNATVLSLNTDAAEFGLGSLPECSNGEKFDDNSVCFTITSTQAIPNNAVIAIVTVRWGAAGTATVTATDGNIYRFDEDRIDSGLKATYTLGDFPNTPLFDGNNEGILLFTLGLTLLFTGFYLRSQANKNERSY